MLGATTSSRHCSNNDLKIVAKKENPETQEYIGTTRTETASSSSCCSSAKMDAHGDITTSSLVAKDQGLSGLEALQKALEQPQSSSSSSISGGSNHQTTLLPYHFVPGPHDVWCGRGRACKQAAGNVAYRRAVLAQLPAYAAATTKHQKGAIISQIVHEVRRRCHAYHAAANAAEKGGTTDHSLGDNNNSVPLLGGFVKRRDSDGAWVEVGDFLAREKTSQCFRDALSHHYSSSAQSKYQRRRRQKRQHREQQQVQVVESQRAEILANNNNQVPSPSQRQQQQQGVCSDYCTGFSPTSPSSSTPATNQVGGRKKSSLSRWSCFHVPVTRRKINHLSTDFGA